MERGSLHRLRWRRRGAWLWPVFVAAIVADAALGHLWPPAGDGESIAGAAIAGLGLNLLAVLLLARPLGAVLRRFRPDFPGIVARNYAGTSAVLAVSVALFAAGLVHHSTIMRDESAMRDATVRAEAWIGDHAPSEFQRNVKLSNTFAIQSGSLYRTCVPSSRDGRSYCVIVRTQLPFARSVRFAGSEPNYLFAAGVN